jgi:hypothetical protein
VIAVGGVAIGGGGCVGVGFGGAWWDRVRKGREGGFFLAYVIIDSYYLLSLSLAGEGYRGERGGE